MCWGADPTPPDSEKFKKQYKRTLIPEEQCFEKSENMDIGWIELILWNLPFVLEINLKVTHQEMLRYITKTQSNNDWKLSSNQARSPALVNGHFL